MKHTGHRTNCNKLYFALTQDIFHDLDNFMCDTHAKYIFTALQHNLLTVLIEGDWGPPKGKGQVNNLLFRSLQECAQEARSDRSRLQAHTHRHPVSVRKCAL